MSETVLTEKHTGPVIHTKNGFSIIDCQVCQFKHVYPLPTKKELAEIYQHDYYTTSKPFFIEQSEEDRQWWSLVFNERYEIFESLLQKKQRKLLDVGTGPGHFLSIGYERGWQTMGIEPSLQASEYAINHGLKVIQGFFDESSIKDLTSYDVIHANDVLEHIPDPIGFVKLAYKLLKNRGIICIAVPNDFNILQKKCVELKNITPWWIAPPHHLNYFDFQSLSLLLENNGFNVEYKDTSFPMEIFLAMGDIYTKDDELGRTCHKKRVQLESFLQDAGLSKLKRQWYNHMAEQGIGRHVILYARKVS